MKIAATHSVSQRFVGVSWVELGLLVDFHAGQRYAGLPKGIISVLKLALIFSFDIFT
jgi:hypothetical protein